MWATEVDVAATTWSDPVMLLIPVREWMIAMRAWDEKLLTARAKAIER